MLFQSFVAGDVSVLHDGMLHHLVCNVKAVPPCSSGFDLQVTQQSFPTQSNAQAVLLRSVCEPVQRVSLLRIEHCDGSQQRRAPVLLVQWCPGQRSMQDDSKDLRDVLVGKVLAPLHPSMRIVFFVAQGVGHAV